MALALTTPAEHLPAMLEVLGGAGAGAQLPARTRFDTERERSLAQFANDVDDPWLLADRALQRTVWGAHPYGHDVAGTRASVARLRPPGRGRLPRATTSGPRPARLFVVGAVDPVTSLARW